MNYIFFFLVAISVIAGLLNNRLDSVTSAMIDSCDIAIKIAFSLIGIMAFWLGIMRVAEESGLIKIISKLIYPVARLLFNDVKKDSSTLGDITMSLSANALGLTNAATPIGLKVMKELQEDNENKEVATDSMCMFLGMNTAGFQIIPVTVIAILAGMGCSNPTRIIIPTLIVTTLAFITAIITALLLKKIYKLSEDKLCSK